MPTYQKAPPQVADIAREVIEEFEGHHPLKLAGVKIEYLFAFADVNDQGKRTSDALSKNGLRALGICRKVPTKERAMGRGDVEISIDGDWWNEVGEEKQKALLDHELYHIQLTGECDDLRRPKIKLRKHDFEVGWFAEVAARHGMHSIERQQAAEVMECHGQFFWPGIVGKSRVA